MKRALSFAKAYWAAIGAAIIIIGIIVSFASGNGEAETIVATPGVFLQQVSVSGRVMADQEVDLGFSQSGRISRVYTKEGDRVFPGTLIAEIENGDLYALLLQRQAALEKEEAALDALKRGTRPEELAVTESALDSARAALDAANQGLLDAVLAAYATSDSSVRATVDQFFSNPRSASPQLNFQTASAQAENTAEAGRISIESALNAWQAATVGLSAITAEGAVPSAQQYLNQASQFLSDISTALAASVPSSSVTQGTLDSYKSSVATARTNLNSATASLTTALKTQSAARTALVTAEKDLALARAGATPEDIRKQEAAVKAAEADVLSASSQLAKTQIRAPFAGIVTKIDAKVGKSVSPAEAQASVIGTGTYQIESFVPEINVALVKQGDPAIVTFDSYGPEVQFGARVATVDLGETIKDGVSTYRTVLVFDQNDDRIRSGMTTNVVITTAEKPDTISIPQRLVRLLNGAQVVSVLEDGAVVDRTVTTGGISSLGDIEILTGLSAGDVVVVE